MNQYPECFICKETSISGCKPLGGRVYYLGQDKWVCYRCRSDKIIEIGVVE